MLRASLAAAAALSIAACAAVPPAPPDSDAAAPPASVAAPAVAPTTPAPRLAGARSDPVARALNASDRPSTHPARDAERQSAAVLTFSGIGPGDRVLDLGALTGYSTWLLSGLVGPEGAVVAQNPRGWFEQYETVAPRMAELSAARPNATHEVMEFDQLRGEPGSFDAVVSGLVYHDAAYMDVDRIVMNQQVYDLLKPDGVYLVIDHRAAAGSGVRDVQSLHRIDPAQVRREVESVGFRFDGELDVLNRPEDDLTHIVFDESLRGQTSQFVHRYVKPGM